MPGARYVDGIFEVVLKLGIRTRLYTMSAIIKLAA